MPVIFNDIGNPSSDPCGFIVGEKCNASAYKSWHRAANELAGKIAGVELDGPVEDQVMATAMRAELKIFPSPSAIHIALWSEAETRLLAKLTQRMADLLPPANLPPAMLEPSPKPQQPGIGRFFAGLTWGTVLGVGAVVGGLYYARKQEWI